MATVIEIKAFDGNTIEVDHDESRDHVRLRIVGIAGASVQLSPSDARALIAALTKLEPEAWRVWKALRKE